MRRSTYVAPASYRIDGPSRGPLLAIATSVIILIAFGLGVLAGSLIP